MIDQANVNSLLRRVDMLGREVEQLRRDLLHGVVLQPTEAEHKPSLFGSVHAGDITGELIEEAREELFRPLDDV